MDEISYLSRVKREIVIRLAGDLNRDEQDIGFYDVSIKKKSWARNLIGMSLRWFVQELQVQLIM